MRRSNRSRVQKTFSHFDNVASNISINNEVNSSTNISTYNVSQSFYQNPSSSVVGLGCTTSSGGGEWSFPQPDHFPYEVQLNLTSTTSHLDSRNYNEQFQTNVQLSIPQPSTVIQLDQQPSNNDDTSSIVGSTCSMSQDSIDQQMSNEEPVTKRRRGRPSKTQSTIAPADKSNDKQKYSCSICSNKFTALGSLRRHEITHTENKQPFACDTCNKRFTQASTLASHKRAKHEGIRYQCKLCPGNFFGKKEVETHLRNHHNCTSFHGKYDVGKFEKFIVINCVSRNFYPSFQCPNCPERFLKQQQLQQHGKVHEGQISSNQEEKIHKCQMCPIKFTYLKSFREHLRSHRNRVEVEKIVTPNTPITKWMFIRELPKEGKERLTYLKTFDPTIDLPTCNHCGKIFVGPGELLHHVKIHKGKKRQCPHCGKRFSKPYELTDHILTHIGRQQHVSKYCGQSFDHIRLLQLHEIIHEERGKCSPIKFRWVYTCTICDKIFLKNTLLRQHFTEKHRQEFSIPVKRFEVKPVGEWSNINCLSADSSSTVLCTSCGNSYSTNQYKYHEILSTQCVGVRETQNEDLIQSEEAIHIPEIQIKQEELPSEMEVEGDPIYAEAIFDSPFTAAESELTFQQFVRSPHNQFSYQNENFELSEAMEGESITEGIADNISPNRYVEDKSDSESEQITTEKVQYNPYSEAKILTKLKLTDEIIQKYTKPFSIIINRTLFKPLPTPYRTICMVKPCEDTFYIPWYTCGKCGRTLTIKEDAHKHKIHSCINKFKYSSVPLPADKRSTDEGDSSSFLENDLGVWKLTWTTGLYLVNGPDLTCDPRIKILNGIAFCTICEKKLPFHSALTHMDHHDIARTIEPSEVSEFFARNDQLDPRIRLLEDGLKGQCTICEKTMDLRYMKKHVLVHDSKFRKTWLCKECGVTLATRTTYHDHMRIHTGEKPFKCRFCGQGYANKPNLYIHEKNKHSTTSFKCDECSYVSKTYSGLMYHRQYFKGKGIKCQTHFHTTYTDRQRRSRRYGLPKNAIYQCDKCPKTVKGSSSFRRHKIIFHQDNGITPKFFHCSLCESGFSLLASMRSHLRKTHHDILPTELLTQDKVAGEDGSVISSLENFFTRKFWRDFSDE